MGREPIGPRVRPNTMKTMPGPMMGTLLAIPLLLLVGACGIGSTSADKTSAGSERKSVPEIGAPDAAGQSEDSGDRASAPGKAGGATQVGATTTLARAVISTGQVTLHTPSIGKARSEVMRLVGTWNGAIADEQTNSDDRGQIQDTTMTLRVPSEKFSEAMIALGQLGDVEQESRTSEDVTTQVIDNEARVRAAERSIRQIERLLDRATQLSDIIAIEADLVRRQSDLDSLKSQQAWLRDQTSLATINVYISRESDEDEDDEAKGFLAGLGDGWSALKASTVALLTVVGAALPFAVALAVIGVPLWLVVRRRRPIAPPAAPAES